MEAEGACQKEEWESVVCCEAGRRKTEGSRFSSKDRMGPFSGVVVWWGGGVVGYESRLRC